MRQHNGGQQSGIHKGGNGTGCLQRQLHAGLAALVGRLPEWPVSRFAAQLELVRHAGVVVPEPREALLHPQRPRGRLIERRARRPDYGTDCPTVFNTTGTLTPHASTAAQRWRPSRRPPEMALTAITLGWNSPAAMARA
jgi:hypothetical protein